MSREKENEVNPMENLAKFIQGMVPAEEIKKSISEDKKFVDSITANVVTQLIAKGYVEDKLLSKDETMEIIGIKNVHILYKLAKDKKNPLIPVRIHETAHPKFKLSDVNRYIGNLQAVRK